MPEEYTFALCAPAFAKKNRQVAGFRKDGKQFRRYSTEARQSMDDMLNQIPPDLRRQGFIHPDITLMLQVPNGKSDKDGMLTNVLDCLKQQGVIVDDNIAWCNGDMRIPPAEVSADRLGIACVLVTIRETIHGRMGSKRMDQIFFERDQKKIAYKRKREKAPALVSSLFPAR